MKCSAFLAFSIIAAANANAGTVYGSIYTADYTVGESHQYDITDLGTTLAGPYGSVIINSSPLPSISAISNSPPPPIDGSGNAAAVTVIEANLWYSFLITGPTTGLQIPVFLSGRYSLSAAGNNNPYINAYNAASVGLIVYGGPEIYRLDSGNCTSSYEGTSGCGDIDFTGKLLVLSDYDVQVGIGTRIENHSVNSSNYGNGTTRSSSTTFIDPYFYIDPVWMSSNPGYSLIVESGFGNEPSTTSAVPEPSSCALMLSGLALMGAAHQRRKSRDAVLSNPKVVSK